jgi:hypothetical protein
MGFFPITNWKGSHFFYFQILQATAQTKQSAMPPQAFVQETLRDKFAGDEKQELRDKFAKAGNRNFTSI